jgi:hypothetical protein
MKKWLIHFILNLFSFGLLAQVALKPSIFIKQTQIKELSGSNHLKLNQPSKSMESIIWADDFSNQSHWIRASASSTPDNWFIGTTGPQGVFPIDVITSTTASNGFAIFDSDNQCSGDQIANLSVANPINCVGHPYVQLSFQQSYKRFDDSTFVFVSLNGTNWNKFPVNVNYNNNNEVTSNELINLDISAIAGNQANVWIRFQFWSPSTYLSGPGSAPGCGYSWMIDDVVVADLPACDLAMVKGKSYTYSMAPYHQGQLSPFEGIATNLGSATQMDVRMTISVEKDGVNLFSMDSPALDSLPKNENGYLFEPSSYLAHDIGEYTVNYSVYSTGLEENPGDNSLEQEFLISDSTFAVDGGWNNTVDGINNGYDSTGTNPLPYKIGNLFPIKVAGNTIARSITFAIAVGNAGGIPNSINQKALVSLYKVDSNAANYFSTSLLVSSDTFTVSASNLTPLVSSTDFNYITLPFLTPYEITEDGEYLAVVEYLGSPSFSGYFNVGTSNPNLAQRPRISWLFDPSLDSANWFYFENVSPVIRLNVTSDIPIGIEKPQKKGQDIVVFPNPSLVGSILEYQLAENSKVEILLFDSKGQKTSLLNVIEKPIGTYQQHLDFSQFPKGIYVIQLITNSNCKSQKVVIQ